MINGEALKWILRAKENENSKSLIQKHAWHGHVSPVMQYSVHGQRKQLVLRSHSLHEIIINISFVIHINTLLDFHPVKAGKSLENFELKNKIIYIFKRFLWMLCWKLTVKGCGKNSDVHKYLLLPLYLLAFEKLGSSPNTHFWYDLKIWRFPRLHSNSILC